MQKNREAQEESQKRREELIKELEEERTLRRQEKELQESRCTAWLQEIDAQVGSWHRCWTLAEYQIQFPELPVIVGGAEAPGATGGAKKDRTGRGGGSRGCSRSRGRVEVGDTKDDGERTPGEGKTVVIHQSSRGENCFSSCLTTAETVPDTQQTSIGLDMTGHGCRVELHPTFKFDRSLHQFGDHRRHESCWGPEVRGPSPGITQGCFIFLQKLIFIMHSFYSSDPKCDQLSIKKTIKLIQQFFI